MQDIAAIPAVLSFLSSFLVPSDFARLEQTSRLAKTVASVVWANTGQMMARVKAAIDEVFGHEHSGQLESSKLYWVPQTVNSIMSAAFRVLPSITKAEVVAVGSTLHETMRICVCRSCKDFFMFTINMLDRDLNIINHRLSLPPTSTRVIMAICRWTICRAVFSLIWGPCSFRGGGWASSAKLSEEHSEDDEELSEEHSEDDEATSTSQEQVQEEGDEMVNTVAAGMHPSSAQPRNEHSEEDEPTPNDKVERTASEDQEVLHRSIQDALQQEQEHLTEAMLRSKVDAMAEHEDDVVVSRLTDCSQWIQQALLRSAHLDDCLKHVLTAGCEISPEWANGALLLVPLSVETLREEGYELRKFNIVHYRRDLTLIKQALSSIPKRQDRPRVKDERHAGVESVAATVGGGSSPLPNDEHNEELVMQQDGNRLVDEETLCCSYEVVVENTFYTVRSVCDSNSSMKQAQSAP
eukprot:CAMPEP_0172820302 /NCGR_PEP_ID=MMETSP1075-20121228/15176_1 /TAXON_ID=2916 /ORGANISM="Ceratium fusus, Strain PA161109" /LENGTH=465 /DNA_ID=CAMNT_0013660949 /DNA_START=39 /DNA_END=1436 /DNA_ORIENTATION=-